MMDQMEVTKIVGAGCGALLILLVLAWGSETIYATGGGHGDHGEHKMAYVIETDSHSDDVVEEEVEVIDIAALVATADIASGEKVFRKCASCHQVGPDAANKLGPQLNGVVGRPVGSSDGFKYSGALADLGGDWSMENLSAFLENPKEYAPGNKMSFKGLSKPQDRADIIAYLQQAGS